MKLEDQVAPLALAQRMKELGFPQETWVSWYTMHGESIGDFPVAGIPVPGHEHGMLITDIKVEPGTITNGYTLECAAPNVAEIGALLPGFLENRFDGAKTHVSAFGHHGKIGEAAGTTEAEARARLWIALVEAGFDCGQVIDLLSVIKPMAAALAEDQRKLLQRPDALERYGMAIDPPADTDPKGLA